MNFKPFCGVICALALLGCSEKTQSVALKPDSDALESQVLSMKDRAQFIDDMTAQRVQTLLPSLMKKTGIDAWLLISREYNEDPILKTFLPATWLSARRTTIFLFVLEDSGQLQAYAVAPYNVGSVFTKAWDKSTQDDQWQALVSLLKQHNPEKIGINQSQIWAHADGLVVTDFEQLKQALPKDMENKLVSSEPLAIAWLEQRIKPEVEQYKDIVALAHAIIAEGFSNKVVTPGVTTTDDIAWWYRERVRELKLQAWFHPSVSIQRADNQAFDHETTFTNKDTDNVVRPGDLLHVDFGITYLRLNTDTQQHAYVLKQGETSAPDYLNEALSKANQLQDIFTDLFAEGVTGNEILAKARSEAIAQGLKPTIYTHPIGFHGHGAGTTLGMWDAQQGVPGDGDYPLHLNTAYSIELNNAVYLKEWGKEIRIMLEEDAFFDESGVWYLNGRQTSFHLIKSN
ncbi:M24 family metallopeptidase [Thalassotalea agarivorans]|uniref:Xaa-Pro aminopeptidase n=1 Tax=Thalassotalea agarivorans TaxID=349064 RepID=A0A1I0DDR7_THASX|nr:M24 family metallopeptidase [Thalassotalea agarivorans]SET30473.1 Xaa-Pro aminopeptidase [Thalassotalea agarivorans]